VLGWIEGATGGWNDEEAREAGSGTRDHRPVRTPYRSATFSEPSGTPGIDVVRRADRSSVEGLGRMIEDASGLNHITAIAHDGTTRLRAMLALRRGRRSDRTQLQEPGFRQRREAASAIRSGSLDVNALGLGIPDEDCRSTDPSLPKWSL
jgi:hypothetical protein